MTDLILESKDGETIHLYIDDGRSEIVHIKEGGTVKVRKVNPTPLIRPVSYTHLTLPTN